MRWLFGLFVLAACGDNLAADGPEPVRADDLIIVAHPDDDLVFMAPTLAEAIQSGRALTTVYVTGGDGGGGVTTVESRLRALKAAYGVVAGSNDWTCGWIDVTGHPAQHCRLDQPPISLIVLGYPDGGVNAAVPDGLYHLFAGNIASATTIATRPATYDRDGLIGAVASLVERTHPRTIHTLDFGATHGPDHADHLFVGTIAVLARAAAASDAALVASRGYNINFEPATIPDALADAASLPMRAYEACVLGCGVCGRDVCPTLSDPRYAGFVRRHYAIGARHDLSQFVLRSEDGCAQLAQDGTVVIDACDQATPLALTADGALQIAGRCLEVEPTGEVVTSDACTGSPAQTFLVDDEGHVWAGTPAPRDQVEIAMHALCLGPADGVLRADVCGADRDPRWRLERTITTTARADLGIWVGGRKLRLGDLSGDGHADLCSVVGRRLSCALGDGKGGFGRAAAIDQRSAPLAVDPDSLALGDVDGDGRADACGRDSLGTVCATAASQFRAQRWAAPLPLTTTASTLTITGDQLCALGDVGLACTNAGAAAPSLLSAWPHAMQVALGDLDADGAPDWCAFPDAGPACGLATDSARTTDGVTWGYAQDGMVEGSTPMDGELAAPLRALGDVDGDGRSDLCELVGDRVLCAISEGRTFRPRTIWFDVPDGVTATALWLGDLDGDHRADVCVGTANSILCALSP